MIDICVKKDIIRAFCYRLIATAVGPHGKSARERRQFDWSVSSVLAASVSARVHVFE